MDNKELNENIVRCLGWFTKTRTVEHGGWYQWTEEVTEWYDKDGLKQSVPLFSTNHNAIHDFIKTFDSTQLVSYAEWLGACFDEHPTKFIRILKSSPRQCAEAILNVLKETN